MWRFEFHKVVLCFPCNQFGHQENSSGPEIMNALKHVRPGNGFEPKGIMFDKVGVDRCYLPDKLEFQGKMKSKRKMSFNGGWYFTNVETGKSCLLFFILYQSLKRYKITPFLQYL